MVGEPACWIDDILAVTTKHGLIPGEIRLADGTHITLMPKDVPETIDKKAPKELPDDFNDLPAPNWNDPGDKPDTPANRKAAQSAQEAADAEVFGASILEEDK